MAKVKKMAFGGLGSVMGSAAKAVKGAMPAASQMGAAANAANAARQQSMAQAAAQKTVSARPPSFAADYAKNAMAMGQQAKQGAQTRQMPGPMAQTRTTTPNTQSANMRQVVNAKPMTGGMGQAPRMMKSGGAASASKRADGIASKGKTKGRMV